jgi:hypothetical protein
VEDSAPPLKRAIGYAVSGNRRSLLLSCMKRKFLQREQNVDSLNTKAVVRTVTTVL